MPWRARDAHRHKHGLSARQARQWAAVANSLLASCLTDGGSQDTCEARAVRGANSAVGEPELSTQCRLTIQTALTVQPQRLMHNEREYLLAPCVMIVEGVLNGGYVPGEEIRACPWDGMPLVVNHPMNAEGNAVSANSPDVLASYGVGRIFKTQYTTLEQSGHTVTRAQAELWLDTAQATALGGEALQALQMLETQTPLEVSTAFYSHAEQQRGSFYGVPYQEIHRNLRADHLALLPNSTGACNWRDGCGAPRLNTACACQGQEDRSMESSGVFRRFLAMLRPLAQQSGETVLSIAQTDQDVREAIYGALAREQGAEYTNCFIDTVNASDMSFTYREGERLKRRKWRMEEGVLVLELDVEDVQRETTYIPVPVTQEHQEVPMSATEVIKRRVNALIANARSKWTEDDRHMLESQDEAFLIRLEQQPLDAPSHAPTTVQEAIARMPQHLQEPMAAMAQEYEQRKGAAIALLAANQQNPFSAEELQAMTAQRLEALVSLSGAQVPAKSGVASYAGQGLPYLRPVPQEDMPPAPPNTFALVVDRQRKLGLLPAN